MVIVQFLYDTMALLYNLQRVTVSDMDFFCHLRIVMSDTLYQADIELWKEGQKQLSSFYEIIWGFIMGPAFNV